MSTIETVRSAGTKAPSTTMSLLPVPIMPSTCQVSSTFTSSIGRAKKRRSAGDGGVPDATPASAPTITHDACITPVPHPQRPVSRKPPFSAGAWPVGAITPGAST